MNADLLLDTTKDNVSTEFTGYLSSQPKKRAATRIFMCLAQSMKCHYCKHHMTLGTCGPNEKQPGNMATFEHLIDEWSSADGKDNSLDKIVMACHSCNTARNKHRQAEVKKFYAAKFPSKQTFAAFAGVAVPSDYIKMFGVVPCTWSPV